MSSPILLQIPNTAPEFSLNGQVFPARVVDVYDGDSIKCIFNLLGKYYKFTCRITGVDTPEIRTKNKLEKEMGYKIRNIVRKLCLNKIVTLSCFDFDKYGRLLVDVNIHDENIPSLSEWLINNNYSYAYEGGKKQPWSEHPMKNKTFTPNKDEN